MLKSKIESVNGKPMINIDGSLHSAQAYTTYFDECGKWSEFINHGFRNFFVNISFNDLPINNVSGFTPFRKGVFETETPDYSDFDNTVKRILAECPDAFIFPRIHISMPRKWIAENPDETVLTQNGGARESMYSEKFLRDGAELLIKLASHILSCDFSGRIAGWQLCGGTTQEWMHHDLFGSYSEMGMRKFRQWAKKKYGIDNIRIPERADFESGIFTEETSRYYEFCSEMNAGTVDYFAKVLKQFTNNEQIIGVFYGYNAFVHDPLYGLHGLRYIIDSPYIDFYSSPCAYDGARSFGLDWGDMVPVDSVKLHGKLFFTECDIRTHLTKPMQASRPNEYPDNILLTVNPDGSKTVWSGPETQELSLSAIRKAFLHQLSKSSGIWWFDMWGGWYHSEEIMAELEALRKIYDKSISINSGFKSEVALFIDEASYLNLARGDRFSNTSSAIRVAAGNTGVPFDIYMIEDAEDVLPNYRAAIFTAVIPSECGKYAIEFCRKQGIPFLSSTPEKPYISTDELRSFFISCDIHCFNADNCVVYAADGIIGIHTVKDGEVKISLPQRCRVKPLFGAKIVENETDEIRFTGKKNITAVFEITRI